MTNPTDQSKTTKRRKVIQLCGDTSSILALCDDGSMFYSLPQFKGWLPLMNIPQPKRKPCQRKQ